MDSASLTSDATPPCGNCQRSKAQGLYQVVRYLDAGFLALQARSNVAGSLRAGTGIGVHGTVRQCSHSGPIPDGLFAHRRLTGDRWPTEEDSC
jgi:hypothetical protein